MYTSFHFLISGINLVGVSNLLPAGKGGAEVGTVKEDVIEKSLRLNLFDSKEALNKIIKESINEINQKYGEMLNEYIYYLALNTYMSKLFDIDDKPTEKKTSADIQLILEELVCSEEYRRMKEESC